MEKHNKKRASLRQYPVLLAFGLFFLGWILWTTLSRGLSAFSLALFTEATPPPEMPGGLANALRQGECQGEFQTQFHE